MFLRRWRLEQTPLLVALPLLFAVIAYRIGFFSRYHFQCPGILSQPFTRTVPADLPVFRISSELLLPILAAPPMLARRVAANSLAPISMAGSACRNSQRRSPIIGVVALNYNTRFRNGCRVLHDGPFTTTMKMGWISGNVVLDAAAGDRVSMGSL